MPQFCVTLFNLLLACATGCTLLQPVVAGGGYRLLLDIGDGYPLATGHPGQVNTGLPDAEVMRSTIATNSPRAVSNYLPGESLTRR